MTQTDIIGFVGVSILLLAYLLNLLKVYTQAHWMYLILNTIGAALACTASILLAYWPFIILEGVWCAVSLWGMAAKMIAIKE